jgi:hypothetical protein
MGFMLQIAHASLLTWDLRFSCNVRKLNCSTLQFSFNKYLISIKRNNQFILINQITELPPACNCKIRKGNNKHVLIFNYLIKIPATLVRWGGSNCTKQDVFNMFKKQLKQYTMPTEPNGHILKWLQIRMPVRKILYFKPCQISTNHWLYTFHGIQT